MSTFWDQMPRFKPMQIKMFHIPEAYTQIPNMSYKIRSHILYTVGFEYDV